jgi:hypothetical protein
MQIENRMFSHKLDLQYFRKAFARHWKQEQESLISHYQWTTLVKSQKELS